MQRYPILSLLGRLSNGVAGIAALFVLAFMARRWLFLMAAWRTGRRYVSTTPHQPSILLLVPFRNESAALPDLLAHLDQITYPLERLTVVLINDGSTDAGGQIAAGWAASSPQRYLLTLTQNVGKAAALNAALSRFPQGDLIAVYDADERPYHRALAHLAACFIDGRVGAANGRRAVSNPLQSPSASYSAIEAIVHQMITMQAKEQLGLAPALLGSNCVYQRAALEAVGGFLPGALLEDSDLSVRLVRAGWRTRFIPEAVSYHAVPHTIPTYWRQHLRWAQGFQAVAAQHTRPTLETHALPWPLRLELFAFSLGYLDRLAWLVMGGWIAWKAAVARRLPHPYLIILLSSLITPFIQAMVALYIDPYAPRRLRRRVYLLPLFLPLDVAMTLVSVLRKRVAWDNIRNV